MQKFYTLIKNLLLVQVDDMGEARNRIELRKQVFRNIVLFIILLIAIYLYVQSGVSFEKDLSVN
jgi:hypothetical protein